MVLAVTKGSLSGPAEKGGIVVAAPASQIRRRVLPTATARRPDVSVGKSKGRDEEESTEESEATSTEDSSSEEDSSENSSDSSDSDSSDSGSDSDTSTDATTDEASKEVEKLSSRKGKSSVINSPRPGAARAIRGSKRKVLEKRAKGGSKNAGGGDNQDNKEPRERRRRRKRPLTICLTHCRYELVKSTSKRYNLVEVPEDTAWNIYWTDYSVSLERAVEMRRFQIVNHFPGMNEICRKDLLARNLNRMKRVFPEEYNIYPMTWCLPADNNELQAYSSSRRGKTYICKPEMGCQGRGIFLVKNIKDVNPFGRIICQIYIQKPFLIDHLKFDLRIYVLITSCDPLRIWVFEEGLARFATAKYRLPTQNNTENSYMHLTNYAVNKFSRDFVIDEDNGTKRKLTTVMGWLEQRGYDTDTLQKEIDDVIIKTILSAQPTLRHHYRTCFPHHDICSACFEILGFDVLLDHKLKPYVIEVNHSPSFHTDTGLDRDIKESLLRDSFSMLNLKLLDRNRIEREDRRRVQDRITAKLNDAKSQVDAKKDPSKKGSKTIKEEKPKEVKEKPKKEDYDEMQFQWELEHCGRYRLIYPTEDTAKYDKFLAQNQVSLYQDTAASQARIAMTRAKLDEYNVKKQIEEQKRVGAGTSSSIGSSSIIVNKDVKNSSSKEKLRPESSKSSDIVKKPPLKLPSYVLPTNPSNGTNRGFTVAHIISKDECDRVRGLIQRGLLIRSLGIELQVRIPNNSNINDPRSQQSCSVKVPPLMNTPQAYQLLCKVGGLKKMEHEEFRRRHGFVLPNTGGLMSSSFEPSNTATNNANKASSKSNPIIPPKFYMKLNQFSAMDGHGHGMGPGTGAADTSMSMNPLGRDTATIQPRPASGGPAFARQRVLTTSSYPLRF